MCVLAGNLRAACASVSSYLLFYPTDDTMLINKEYYRNLPKGNDDLFTARPVSSFFRPICV